LICRLLRDDDDFDSRVREREPRSSPNPAWQQRPAPVASWSSVDAGCISQHPSPHHFDRSNGCRVFASSAPCSLGPERPPQQREEGGTNGFKLHVLGHPQHPQSFDSFIHSRTRDLPTRSNCREGTRTSDAPFQTRSIPTRPARNSSPTPRAIKPPCHHP